MEKFKSAMLQNFKKHNSQIFFLVNRKYRNPDLNMSEHEMLGENNKFITFFFFFNLRGGPTQALYTSVYV